MNDSSFQLIAHALCSPAGPTLLLADENLLGQIETIPQSEQLRVISNRYDIHQSALQHGLNSGFSDFDFTAIESNSLHTVVYRISKERPVVHHIINQAWRCLQLGGQLLLSGEKSEGIKGFIDKSGKLLGDKQAAQKHGNSYCATIKKNTAFSINDQLDCKNYSTIRSVLTLNQPPEQQIFSKPGVYGWNKLDKGSQLLMDCAEHFCREHGYPSSILDLGCGYGYLSLRTQAWPCQQRTATDNNAAALACARYNFDQINLSVEVVADDCGKSLSNQFEGILCNPPFHQGFDTSSDLTHKFLQQATRLLSPTGFALFVVNAFIPIENLGKDYFAEARIINSTPQFKVVCFRH